MSKRAVIYARVSTDEQSKGYSLPTQLEACRKYAEEQGYTVVKEYADDYSGMSMDRPALNELRSLLDQGGADVVVCYEVDRLARKVVYQLLLEEEFTRRRAVLEYVLARYDATPEGQMMKQFRGVIAEYERAKILERMARGKKGRAQAGQVTVGRIAPYGYDYVGEPHKGQLVVNEEEAKMVRLIFQWYTDGDENGDKLGAYQIARRLSERRIPTKDDTAGYVKRKKEPGVWGKSTVQKILTNETYTGVWH
jgi:site-specific DNA recombinase